MRKPGFLPDLPLGHLVWVLGGPVLTVNALALAALAGSLLDWPAALWTGLVVASLVAVTLFAFLTWRREPNRTSLVGTFALSRFAVLAAGMVQQADREQPTVMPGLLVALAILVEPAIKALTQQAFPYAVAFDGVKVRTRVRLSAPLVFTANLVATWVVALTGGGSTGTVVGVIVGLAALAVTVVCVADTALFVVGRLRFNAQLPRLLKAMGPTFALHWQAPPGSLHQVTMWLDQLKGLGKPFFIITRTTENFYEVAQLGIPVLHRVGLDAVGDVLTPSLRTVFYVNTAILNDHLLRYPHLTHIQLNHGDSDKVASYSPVFRAYDKDFVAGQAAIDRFATAALATAPGFFQIVGRPQVAAVKVAGQMEADAAPTVLYAPTWAGNTDDSNYSSLPWGAHIVEALLRRGCTVVFRPHPYWARNHRTAAGRDAVVDLLRRDNAATGRTHVFGQLAEAELTVFDCFNLSSAMISDVSSVVNDFLFSEKPFAMVAVNANPASFNETFPVARGGYVIDPRGLAGGETASQYGLEAVLDSMLGADPLGLVRRELKAYYLGDIPADQYAGRFAQEAGKYV